MWQRSSDEFDNKVEELIDSSFILLSVRLLFDIDHDWLVCMKERILLDAMFDVPGTDIVEVVLTEDVVRGTKPPEYIRRSPIECEEAETASAELRRSSV